MEKLKIEYKFDFEDFKIIEKIEHSYFENDNISPAEEVLKWYEKNDLTCIAVRNSKNEIIASVNILPLNKKTFNDIYEDKMNEAEIICEQIEKYEDNNQYHIYLSSISIDEKYRNNYKVIATLLRGCIELFDILERRNIKIKNVMADASTIHGRKICNKLFKMNYIRDTNHKSQIYCVDGEEFAKAIKQLKKKFSKE